MIEGDDAQYYLKSGIILLPSFWLIEDKFNMPLEQIHLSGHVPKFQENFRHRIERFFQKMTPENPVVRYNYFIQIQIQRISLVKFNWM